MDKGITGVQYTPLKFGPCPDGYKRLYDEMIRAGILVEQKKHRFKLSKLVYFDVLDNSEKRTLEKLVSIYKRLGRKKVFDTSHEEAGYKKTPECEAISYEFAKQLVLADIANKQ